MMSTAPFVGGLAGTALAIYIQDVYGWRFVFLPAGCAGTIIALTTLMVVRMPKEVQISIPGSIQTTSATSRDFEDHKLLADPRNQGISKVTHNQYHPKMNSSNLQ